jgi:hypothetical protein
VGNAHGKNLCCLAANMDSHEAVAVWQGLLVEEEGIFPWPGGIIDLNYGLCFAFSGCKPEEDVKIAREMRNHYVMLLDRIGQAMLLDARKRGEDDAEDPSDRFTRRLDLNAF